MQKSIKFHIPMLAVFALVLASLACGGVPIPPTVTPGLLAATSAPPTSTSEPPTVTSAPATVTSEPPTATSAPATATSAPPTVTSAPPTVTSVPPTVTHVPPTPTATSVIVPLPLAFPFFVIRATASNTQGNWVGIDSSFLNNNSSAIALTTQNWNPSGNSGVYNNHEIGVWYTTGARWAVFNQDIAAMPVNAAFNIYVPPAGSNRFVHTSSAGTIAGDHTDLDNSSANGNPNAVVFITQNWNPGGGVGTYNKHSVGVWYNAAKGKWSVFNEDQTSMASGVSFNVYIPPAGSTVFVQHAGAGNITNNYTDIDNPSTNGKQAAVVLITQNWNPGGSGGTYNNHPVGVWYNAGKGKWSIFNEDHANMPSGAAFNVLVLGG